jgi:hypothetical protein
MKKPFQNPLYRLGLIIVKQIINPDAELTAVARQKGRGHTCTFGLYFPHKCFPHLLRDRFVVMLGCDYFIRHCKS